VAVNLSGTGPVMLDSSIEQNRGGFLQHWRFCSSSHGQPAHCSFILHPSIDLSGGFCHFRLLSE
jgi:hypothetical protein